MEQAGACEPSQMLYRARSSESVRCDLLLEVLNGSRQQLDALLRRAQHLVGLPLLDPRMLETLFEFPQPPLHLFDRRSHRLAQRSEFRLGGGGPLFRVLPGCLQPILAKTVTFPARALLPRTPIRKQVLVRRPPQRSEEHTSELQSRLPLVCRLLL